MSDAEVQAEVPAEPAAEPAAESPTSPKPPVASAEQDPVASPKKPAAVSPKKSPAKPAVAEAESDSSDEEEDKGGSYWSQPPPAKRERKTVARLDDVALVGVKTEIAIQKGVGRALGDIPYVSNNIETYKKSAWAFDVLREVHKTIWKKVETPKEMREHLLKWSGLPKNDKQEHETERLKGNLMKKDSKAIQVFATFLGVERGGTKAELADRVGAFLAKPEDKGVKPKDDAGKSRGKKRASTGAAKKKSKVKRAKSAFIFFSMDKRKEVLAATPGLSIGDVAKRVGELWNQASAADKKPYEEKAAADKERAAKARDGLPTAKKAAAKRAPAAKKRKADEESEEDEEETEDESEEEEEEEESEFEEATSKKRRTAAGAKKKKAKPPTPSGSDEEDDEPAKAEEPENEATKELKAAVEAELDGADLDQMTKRSLIEKVGQRLGRDVSEHKPYIVELMTKLLN